MDDISNSNLIFIDKKLDYSHHSVELVHSLGLNRWKGWQCSAGLRTLYIDFDGNIFRGTCGEGGWIGNVNNTTGFTNGRELSDKKWVTCGKEVCSCGADMAAAKIKDPDRIPIFFDRRDTLLRQRHILRNHKDTVEPELVVSKDSIEFKLISWEVGRRCNFNCWYCAPNSHNNFEGQKNLEQLESAYDRLRTVWIKNDRVKFNFTGGEPTVHKDYLPFVKKLKSDDHVIMTTTNGSHSADYYSELAQYSDICFSIHLNYVKQFGVQKFIRSIQAARDTIQKAKEEDTIAKHNLVIVRIMLDPGNLETAKQFHSAFSTTFNDILLSIDTVHQTQNGHVPYEYTQEELDWVTLANKH